MNVKEGLKEAQDNKIVEDNFWGILISAISGIQGMFILYHTDILIERLDMYLLGLDENIFGWLLILFGISKLVGILLNNRHLRSTSIIGLSIVWGMLFTVAVLWSFGIGYPSDAFITNGLALVICLRIAHVGIFNGVD